MTENLTRKIETISNLIKSLEDAEKLYPTDYEIKYMITQYSYLRDELKDERAHMEVKQ